MSIMEDDISKLIDYAFDHKISEEQIKVIALAAFDEYAEARKKSKKRFKLFKIFVFCITLAALAAFLQSRLGYVLLRLVFLKFLPAWDWTSHYRSNCLLSNPFFESSAANAMNSRNCTTCSFTNSIPRVSNLSKKDALYKYIDVHVPVILGDTTQDWPARKHFNLKFIKELFSTDMTLSTTPPCFLQTNVEDSSSSDLHEILTKLGRKGLDLTHFYVHWENCDRQVIKVLRKFYKRPRFLPTSVEMAYANWLVISSNENSEDYVTTDLGTSVTWLAQIKGSNKVRLRPSFCNTTCKDLYATLHEGDLILWTQPFWELSYKSAPSSSAHTISMLFGGFSE